MLPAMRIKNALIVLRRVAVLDASLKLPTNPRLKISKSAPKTIPLTPASDNIRLVASEKQWIAPREQMTLIPSTTNSVVLRLDGIVKG